MNLREYRAGCFLRWCHITLYTTEPEARTSFAEKEAGDTSLPCCAIGFNAWTKRGMLQLVPRRERVMLVWKALPTGLPSHACFHHGRHAMNLSRSAPPNQLISDYSTSPPSSNSRKQDMQKAIHKLPTDTEICVVAGGNHRGFASYSNQPLDWEVS